MRLELKEKVSKTDKFDDQIKSLNCRGQSIGEILMRITDEKCIPHNHMKISSSYPLDLDTWLEPNLNWIETS